MPAKNKPKKGLCNPENHRPPNLPYSEEEVHSGEELEQHYREEQGAKGGTRPRRVSQPTQPGWSRRKKGKTVKPAATRFKLARNAGLSFARSHPHPSAELGTSSCSPRAQHLPTEALGTTQPNPVRSHACVSPLGSYQQRLNITQ